MPASPASDPSPYVFPIALAVVLAVALLGVLWRTVLPRCRSAPAVVLADGEVLASTPLPPAIPVGRVPVWFYRPLDLLGAMFVFAVFAGMAMASIHAPGSAVEDLNPAVLALNIGFQFMLAGLVFVSVAFRVGLVEWLGLRWSGWYWAILIGPGAVIGIWMFLGGLQKVGYMDWLKSLGVEQVQDSVKLLHESKNPWVIGLMSVAAVLVAPLCEEVVFRGYFYPVLKRFGGLAVAAFCSSLLFSCAHGSLVALLPLFIFGLVQVVAYEKTGSLWAPIAVHFCFNSATVALQLAIRYLELPVELPS